MNGIKSSKAITLIALVVTIVVLLILAGISIQMLKGDNGIVTKSNEAKLESRAGNVDEEVKMWKNNNKMIKRDGGTKDEQNKKLTSNNTNSISSNYRSVTDISRDKHTNAKRRQWNSNKNK